MDWPILAFLLVSALAALASIEPLVSIPKLRSAALVLIVPVAAGVIRSRRQAFLVILVLMISAGVSAGLTWWEKVAGRGVEVMTLEGGSPLLPYFQPGDIILNCDGNEIDDPIQFQRFLAGHSTSSPFQCTGLRAGTQPFRADILFDRDLPPPRPEVWGYQVKVSRSGRARGSYTHFVTYAEVMLQLAALASGIWLSCPRKWSRTGIGLLGVATLFCGALAATLTRACWIGLAVAGLVMLWLRINWRRRLIALISIALALVGMNALLVEWRGVGFYDPSDISLQYRRMMWEDGFRLMHQYPWLGIGMDASLTHWQELGLRAYEKFHLHSHFHSTPVQLVVERGLLGFGAWLVLLGAYLKLLLRLVKRTKSDQDWWIHGIALGILGATAGFLASGLVHYNFGDSEVVMLFWLLAGVAIALQQRIPAARGVHPNLIRPDTIT